MSDQNLIAENLLIDHLTELQNKHMGGQLHPYGNEANLMARVKLVQDALQELKDLKAQKKKLTGQKSG
jgi:hypothetical protein